MIPAHKALQAGLALAALAWSMPTQADSVTSPYNDYRDRIKVAQTVQPLGETPFGENINLYKGGLSFRQTDISFPGIGPTITLARSYQLGGVYGMPYVPGEMRDWSLSIPRIVTTVPGDRFSQSGSWVTPTTARCSGFGHMSAAPYGFSGGQWLGQTWWHGYQLVTPDGATRPLLKRVTENTLTPPSGGPYNIVTADHWMIACVASTSNGQPGEGFLAIAPDGTRYTFDYLVYGPAIQALVYETGGDSLAAGESAESASESDSSTTSTDEAPSGEEESSDGGASTNVQSGGGTNQYLPRKVAYMYLTRIEDRFGNTLTYNYSSGQLTSIVASDGRQVYVNWVGSSIDTIVVQPADAQAQTWHYEYNGYGLSRVVLPDNSTWSFTMNSIAAAEPFSAMDSNASTCGLRSGLAGAFTPVTATITHPSGLFGSFQIGEVGFARSAVPTVCDVYGLTESLPVAYSALSLLNKTISGPGMASRTWQYTYSPEIGSSDAECATNCVDTAWVEVTDPDGSITRFTHSTRWGVTEGKLLSVIQGITTGGQTNPVGLNLRTYTYASPSAGPYPARIGDSPDHLLSNNAPSEYLAPQQQMVLTQQGVTFTNTTNSFDAYANPTSVTRASSGSAGGNNSRTETMTYAHDTAKWVIGQLATTTDVATSKVLAQTDYDSATRLPWKNYRSGRLKNTLTYNANGTLATVKDGRDNVISLSNWYRGIPRRIDYPTSAYVTATVNDLGWISGTTDELGYSTTYGYDTMGRLSSIAYPTADTNAWAPLARGFVPVASSEYNIGPGHWKQTVLTGNGKATTYYDGLWNPVLVLNEDTANAASKSFVVTRYDSSGRPSFQSYAVDTLSDVNSTALKGSTTTYDKLGRVYQVKQDSELGLLTTTNEYLTGFITRVTNPRGYISETKYQLFDSPSMDAPVEIVTAKGQTEQQTTVIERDGFGKPLSVTRSGAAP